MSQRLAQSSSQADPDGHDADSQQITETSYAYTVVLWLNSFNGTSKGQKIVVFELSAIVVLIRTRPASP